MKLKTEKLINSWPFLLGLVLGLYLMVFNIIGFDFSYFPGDLGDGRFNMYILEHGHKFLAGQEDSLWNAPFFYPAADVITFSDNLIGTVPIYSFFRVLGYDVVTSFQFWFITLTILSYTTCYFFLKWTFRNKYAAVLGAFLFAFSIALQSQMTHAQVFPRFFIPLALWMLLLFKKDLQPKYFFLAILFLVLQFYAGVYLGFMLAVPFGILLILIVFQKRKLLFNKAKKIRWWLFSGGSIIINLGILGVLMYPYLQRSREVGTNSYETIVGTLPSFRSFFYSQDGTLCWDVLSNTGSRYDASWDHQIFPGGMAILSLIIVGICLLFRKRWPLVKEIATSTVLLLIIAGGLTIIIFMRYQGYSLYQLVYMIPGFGSMRSLTRIINLELLFFSIAVAFASMLLLKKYSNYSAIIFVGFLGLLATDNYFKEEKSYRTDKAEAQWRVEELRKKMTIIPEGSVVSYEPSINNEPAFYYQLDAMLATQSLGLKSVNGYSGNSPKGFNDFWWDLDEESRLKWFDYMDYHPDSLYIIH